MTYETFQKALECVSLAAFAAIATAAGVCVLAVYLAPFVRWMKRHCLDALLVSPFVVCMVWYAATKQGSVSYPYTDPESRYLYDNGSYVTNGYLHVNFTRLPIVPASADFQGWYRAAGSTNDAEWAQFLDTTFAEFPVPTDIAFEGAETNDFQFFTTWTPGPAAHTNGVAEIQWRKGFLDPANASAVPWRTGLYIGPLRVAPNPAITNNTTTTTP